MKAQAGAQALPAARSRAADYLELTKPRIALMALLTTLAGVHMASPGPMDPWLAFHALLGTGLVAAGANALNQYLERRWDALMIRTRQRPIPARRLAPAEALVFGGALGAAGLVYLTLMTRPLASLLAAAALGLYLFAYTPLKRLTTLNTLVGAVPGALPPLIGWAAVSGRLPTAAWTLFAILFVWQIPHFMAIAWMHREDYERGGYKMLSVVDRQGRRTAHQILAHGLALIVVSFLPMTYGLAGRAYFFAALALGAVFFAFGAAAAVRRSDAAARALLRASLLYLPLLYAAMMLDKT